MSTQPSEFPHKAGRAQQAGGVLAIAKVAGNLALASGVTIALLFGMVLALCSALLLIVKSGNPALGLGIALVITIAFNAIAFFVSPWIMDLVQNWLYHTKWVSIEELERRSPESAHVIRRVCSLKKIKQPRIGIIDDQNPTAFTYGALPDSARLVVSAGLFTYLDDDEVATVYAHELGHIVHWDFAIMTMASTLIQIMYLIYIGVREFGRKLDDRAESAAAIVAVTAYVFYLVGTYLLLYLSRTREYFADHFAAETTGNPNALSRALVKIAYGILEESEKAKEPSRLIQGTRALGIYDAKAAVSTGSSYRISSQPEKVGRVFLWDLFNPWGWWLELSSTHPLTGKRVRALSTYAEQLGLDMEFDMGRVIAEGNQLSKQRLYGSFFTDLLFYCAEFLAIVAGLIVGAILAHGGMSAGKAFVAIPLLCLGIALLVKRTVMFPNSTNAPTSDIMTLMSDPYASPLRGRPVTLKGKVIGRGDAGYVFGSDMKLQDQTGMIYLLYASRWGPIGNFLAGMNKVKDLIGTQTTTKGWFRRGVAPWMDLELITTDSGKKHSSHPAFWSLVGGIICLAIGALLLVAKF
ncbi:zinc metalloprotease HtpX [Tumidithrix helvetica PCC 7403]|uniref:zinc metalloprotease HtpX n=1 Tax=Tumidithrix helvetica TaxID=3457545 RepID=UPI003CC0EB50